MSKYLSSHTKVETYKRFIKFQHSTNVDNIAAEKSTNVANTAAEKSTNVANIQAEKPTNVANIPIDRSQSDSGFSTSVFSPLATKTSLSQHVENLTLADDDDDDKINDNNGNNRTVKHLRSCKHTTQITLTLDHSATLLDRPNSQGHTHEWQMYVRCLNEVGEDRVGDLFRKVEFYLHESFANRKIVLRETPYTVSKSGYASFLLKVDAYFTKSAANLLGPRKVRFYYNLVLDLQQSVQHTRYEKLNFVNLDEEFKRVIISCGGTQLSGSGGAVIGCYQCSKIHSDLSKFILPLREIRSTAKSQLKFEDSGLERSSDRSNHFQYSFVKIASKKHKQRSAEKELTVGAKKQVRKGRKPKKSLDNNYLPIQRTPPLLSPQRNLRSRTAATSKSTEESYLSDNIFAKEDIQRENLSELIKSTTSSNNITATGILINHNSSSSSSTTKTPNNSRKKVSFATVDNVFLTHEDDLMEGLGKKRGPGKPRRNGIPLATSRSLSRSKKVLREFSPPGVMMKEFMESTKNKKKTGDTESVKVPSCISSIVNKYNDEDDDDTNDLECNKIKDNIFYEPLVTELKRPRGRPKKRQNFDEVPSTLTSTKSSSTTEKSTLNRSISGSFFQASPSMGTRNVRKATNISNEQPPDTASVRNVFNTGNVCGVTESKNTVFSGVGINDPSAFSMQQLNNYSQPSYNVSIPSFLTAPNDEDDSDYGDDDDDDDDDDVIVVDNRQHHQHQQQQQQQPQQYHYQHEVNNQPKYNSLNFVNEQYFTQPPPPPPQQQQQQHRQQPQKVSILKRSNVKQYDATVSIATTTTTTATTIVSKRRRDDCDHSDVVKPTKKAKNTKKPISGVAGGNDFPPILTEKKKRGRPPKPKIPQIMSSESSNARSEKLDNIFANYSSHDANNDNKNCGTDHETTTRRTIDSWMSKTSLKGHKKPKVSKEDMMVISSKMFQDRRNNFDALVLNHNNNHHNNHNNNNNNVKYNNNSDFTNDQENVKVESSDNIFSNNDVYSNNNIHNNNKTVNNTTQDFSTTLLSGNISSSNINMLTSTPLKSNSTNLI